MNYLRHYENLILSRKNNLKSKNTESHHILPTSLKNNKFALNLLSYLLINKNNLNETVNLTCSEHYIAHLLLARIFDKKSKYSNTYCFMKMFHAANLMTGTTSNNKQKNKKFVFKRTRNFTPSGNKNGNFKKGHFKCWVDKYGEDIAIEKQNEYIKKRKLTVKSRKNCKGYFKCWVDKYGIEIANQKQDEYNKKRKSLTVGVKNGRAKKLYQYDLDLNLIKVYDYLTQYKLSNSDISIHKIRINANFNSSANNELKVLNNFIFSFVELDNNKKEIYKSQTKFIKIKDFCKEFNICRQSFYNYRRKNLINCIELSRRDVCVIIDEKYQNLKLMYTQGI